MARIEDYMDNDWYRSMYTRYARHDPSNINYRSYDNPGLNTTITISSNPEYSVQLKRYQNGMDKWTIGGISPLGVQNQTKMNACAEMTGMPHGCADRVLGEAMASERTSVTYRNVNGY